MKVSVCVITYNHEKFIEECLLSILNQETNFDFEIVIGEDGSSDLTRTRIENCIRKYPGNIKLLPDVGNLGMMPNFIRTLKACTGTYIAICEGDDYWTDISKLQEQVDFLDHNTDFVSCYTDIQHYSEKDAKTTDLIQEGIDTIQLPDLFNKNYITTLTAMFRNNVLEFPEEFSALSVGDWPLFTLLSQFGKIKRLPRITGVYRIHASNSFQVNSYLEKKTKVTEATEFLLKYLEPQYQCLAREKLIESYYILSILHIKSQDKEWALKYCQLLRSSKLNAPLTKILKLRFLLFSYELKIKFKL